MDDMQFYRLLYKLHCEARESAEQRDEILRTLDGMDIPDELRDFFEWFRADIAAA